uniref:Putative common plant regulatory factor 1 n=2 Tax=Davidia involucrata TaxID=16924 RepID=A0A5B7C036_DAVIN
MTMGNSEEGKPCKPEKPSSPALDQTNIHVYPDWAAMQAYYGHRVAVPPYFNSAVASGNAPHPYMWGPPQAMMPPYGAPYAAIYAHGGVYAHPGVPLGSHSHGHGVLSFPAGTEALAATRSSMETPAKSSGNTDQGLMKKLKGYNGLAMSIGNGNADSGESGPDHGDSQSAETGGSSDGSDGNTSGACQNGRKRSREGSPAVAGGDGKTEMQNSPVPAGELNGASNKVMGVTVTHASVAGKMVGTVLSPSMTTPLELRNTSDANPKTSPTSVPQPCAVIPGEAWRQNERELKRERRKQSNRESARRSRLRKQSEAEELAVRVESLCAENTTLKSEINCLTENSEKLKHENATLMEKLKNAQLGQTEEVNLDKIDDKRVQPLSTENLLSRVNNSGSVDKSDENNSNSGAKLHQLLDTSPRTDAVAAG